MLRRTATVLLAAALVFAPAVAASAGEEPPPTSPPPTAPPTEPPTTYPPTEPPAEPTLAGSVVTGICDGDVPYIGFDIELIDPEGTVTTNQATLILRGSGQSFPVPLGTLDEDGQLFGRVLWPGAAVNSDGSPANWPGWAPDGAGGWVEDPENFGWTRSVTSGTLSVNPDLEVAISYPPSTPSCATSPPGKPAPANASSPTPLSTTGVSEWTLPIALGAVALLVIGGSAVVIRRLARR